MPSLDRNQQNQKCGDVTGGDHGNWYLANLRTCSIINAIFKGILGILITEAQKVNSYSKLQQLI